MQNMRTAPQYECLKDTVEGLANARKTFLIPSPGNWGDALINVGTYQFLESIEVQYEVLRRQDLLHLLSQSGDESGTFDALIIVGGGGGWCETWSSTRAFVAEIAPRVSHVIVLPTTYELPPVENAENITYFARDFQMSKEVVPDAIFCHDMAFFLDISMEPESVKLPRLVALRVDKEKSPEAVPFQFSIDVSLLGDAFSSVLPFFQIVNRFDRVVSDRLHVAIAGCLLGKDVTLLPSLYPKSRSVYLSSMHGSYPDCRFSNWGDFKFWPVSELRSPSELDPAGAESGKPA